MDFLLKRIEQILRYQKRWKKWQKVVASLACVVVFITTYALILPAITMDRDEAQSQGGIFWEGSQEAEETVASADEQGVSQDGILSAEEASLSEKTAEVGNEGQITDNYEQYPSDGTEEQVGTGIAIEDNPAERNTPDTDVNTEKPAAVFDEVAGDVTVHVEAPKGAFPAGTTMRVEPVADEQVMDAVQEAVEESVTRVSAVDIIFFDALGNEIEPEAEIRVSMSSSAMENVEQPVIVHVDDEGVAETVESEKVDGAVVFESDRFSVYVMVETEVTTKWTLTTPEGESLTYDISVKYDADANIPEGSRLSVTEFNDEDEEYLKAMDALLGKNDTLQDNELEEIIIDNSGEVPTYSYSSRPVIYEDDFGMKAFDISIIGPNNEMVEPAKAVEVSITIKQLPKDVEKEVMEESMSVSHLKEDDESIQVETVASTDENYPGDIKVMEDTAEITFSVDSFSTFTIQWSQNSRWRTGNVRYVDTNGTELEVSNSTFRGNNLTQTPAYLVYDIEGYEYVKTTLGSPTGTEIRPLLQYSDYRWQYTTGTGTGDVTWTNFNYSNGTNRNVYVVYRPKSTPSDGGKPKVEETAENPLSPSILKTSNSNGDGTNTLSLSITGHTAPTRVEKLADVIVVFDVSGSMNRTMGGDEISGQDYNDTAKNSDHNSRLWIAYDAVSKLTDNLLSNERVNSKGEKLIRMSLISFSNTAQVVQSFTDNPATFKNAVGGLNAIGGTNWEAALRLANTSFTKASDSENVQAMELDPNRATFVIFVTDGAPTFRLTRYNVWDNGFANDISLNWYRNFGVFGEGNSDIYSYNYNAALTEATSIVEHSKNLYSIGISSMDSQLSQLDDLTEESGAGRNHSIIATDQQALIKAFDDVAVKITGLLGFSDINMTDGITDLSSTVMEKAGLMGHSDDFQYWKAPAPSNWSTMTDAQKKMYRPSDEDYVAWDPSTEKCQPANYNANTGAVEWHMGSEFVLEDGYSYKVTFRVWPSQEAYDWIADLNNGAKTWDDVKEAGLDYPDGRFPQIVKNGERSYSLATNKPGANTTYKSATKTGDTVTTTGDPITLAFNTVAPMGLAEKQIAVRKRFSHNINSVSPFSKILFTLLEDGESYKQANGDDYTIVLPTEDGAQPDALEKWESKVYIAPGLIKTTTDEPGYQVLEKGHDYTLTEEILVGDSYEYTFTPQIVRPMVVGTELKYFVKKDSEYNTNPEQKKEYTIDGGTYYELDDDSQALTGTNRKTSELDITKKINDPDNLMSAEQENAETFTYKITLTVPEGADTSGMMAYEYVPRLSDTPPHVSGDSSKPRFYLFGYQDVDINYTDVNGNQQIQKKDSNLGFADDVSKFHGKVYGGWNVHLHNLFGDSNTITFYMTLDNDEVIRLTNLPQNTQYTITEYYANVDKSDQGAPSPSSNRLSNVAAQGYTVSVKQDGSSTAVATDTIEGTISEFDKRYYNQFTNTIGKHIDVELKARKYLNGYVWSNEQYYINLTTDEGNQLPGASGRTRFYRQFSAGSAGDVDQNGYTFGKVRFTRPGVYKYYIAEDQPGQIVEGIRHDTTKTVTITIGENADGLYVEKVEGDATTWNSSTMTSMTTITNSRITAKAKVKKIGDSNLNNPLSNVSFELYSTYVSPTSDQNVKAKKADGTEYGTLTTLTDGTFNIDGLIPSTAGTKYYLVETVAKPGYDLLSSPVEITVYLADNEPCYTVSYMQKNYSASTDAGRISPDDNGYCNIAVDNKSGAELPHTGGSGTLPYTLGGIALITASALMYGFRMRRRERRLN